MLFAFAFLAVNKSDEILKQGRAAFSGPALADAYGHHTGIFSSLSTRVFETQTATGREHFACQGSGVSQIFILIISNRETILSNVNVVV